MERKYCACCGCHKDGNVFTDNCKTCDRCRERQKKKDQQKRLIKTMDKQQKEIDEGGTQYCTHCKMNRKIWLFSENQKLVICVEKK